MKVIDKMLYKALDPISIATELNLIASRHRCSGNQVERGSFGIVKVLFSNGEAHYTPSGRGIEITIYKYEELDRYKVHMQNMNICKCNKCEGQ
jgi:hypothetical protein